MLNDMKNKTISAKRKIRATLAFLAPKQGFIGKIVTGSKIGMQFSKQCGFPKRENIIWITWGIIYYFAMGKDFINLLGLPIESFRKQLKTFNLNR